MKNYKNTKNIIFLLIGILLVVASIIPKGSWSFFSDIESLPNKSLAAGTCRQSVGSDVGYIIKNIYPDNSEKETLNIVIKNDGTFPLNDLYLDSKVAGEDKDKKALNEEEIMKLASYFDAEVKILSNTKKINHTLKLTELMGDAPPNIADWLPEDDEEGLAPDEELEISIDLTFVEKEGEEQSNYEQNSLEAEFFLEGYCN